MHHPNNEIKDKENELCIMEKQISQLMVKYYL